MHALSPRTAIGVQLGYSQDNRDFRDFNSARDDLFNNITVSSDGAYEILGFVSRRGKAVNPFVMAGYRTVSVDTDVRGHSLSAAAPYLANADQDELSGWKVAAGVEMPLAQNWFGQMAVHYTDYGSEEFNLTNLSGGTAPASANQDFEFDLQQTGIRFALGYSF